MSCQKSRSQIVFFLSRSRFKAFPSPVISTNIKTCPLRCMQTQQIFKYDSLVSLILNNWFSFSAGSLRIYTISSSFPFFFFSPFQNPWHFNLSEALFQNFRFLVIRGFSFCFKKNCKGLKLNRKAWSFVCLRQACSSSFCAAHG